MPKSSKLLFVLISNTLLAHLLDCTCHHHHSVHFSDFYLKPRERVKSSSTSALAESPYLCVHGESESCPGMSRAAILDHCLSLTTSIPFSQWFPWPSCHILEVLLNVNSHHIPCEFAVFESPGDRINCLLQWNFTIIGCELPFIAILD